MTARHDLIVLFDIDGTLVRSGRAGVRGLAAAFDELHGPNRLPADLALAGRTDRAIFADALRAIGVEPTAQALARLNARYCECLAVEMGRSVTEPSGVLPGVAETLDALARRPGVVVGLLTGNLERGAAIKLGHFDLWHRFAFGAFGDDHEDRRALVPVALARARAAGVAVPAPSRVVVVGDTPLDVDCAQAHGLPVVAVATGTFSRQALESTGADLVLDSLAERDRFDAWIGELV